MTLYGIYEEWDTISYSRKIDALKAVVSFLEKSHRKDDSLIKELLDIPYGLEADDYFGTEGLRF